MGEVVLGVFSIEGKSDEEISFSRVRVQTEMKVITVQILITHVISRTTANWEVIVISKQKYTCINTVIDCCCIICFSITQDAATDTVHQELLIYCSLAT